LVSYAYLKVGKLLVIGELPGSQNAAHRVNVSNRYSSLSLGTAAYVRCGNHRCLAHLHTPEQSIFKVF
jgi:hypothetical protein